MPSKRYRVVTFQAGGQATVRQEADDLERAIRTAWRLRSTHPTWGPLFVMERTAEGLKEVWREDGEPAG